MIVHCRSVMTETSSTHCFWRCLGRCFGNGRQHPRTKTTLEPMENGFSHLGDEESSNGSVTVVKLCQPTANGFNKQLQSVGEKACCVPDISDRDELRYSYEPVISSRSREPNGPEIAQDDALPNESLRSIGAESDDVLISSGQPLIINQNNAINEKLQLSNGNQYQFKTPELLTDEDTVMIPRRESDKPIESNLSTAENELSLPDDMKELPPKVDIEIKLASDGSETIAHSAVAVGAENQKVYCSVSNNDDSKSSENAVALCNGSICDNEIKGSALEGQVVQSNKNLVDGGDSNGIEGHGIHYFQNMVQSETTQLNDLIQKWEKILTDEPDVQDEVQDEIRSTNGQTRLVICERFLQFKSLIEQSEKQANGELKDTKIITLTDLQGFWDMIYFQVEDVLVKFQRLEKVKSANWNPLLLHENGKTPQPVKKTRRPATARTKKTSKTAVSQSSNISDEEKARRLAARKRLAEARKKMAAQERRRNSTSDESFIVQ